MGLHVEINPVLFPEHVCGPEGTPVGAGLSALVWPDDCLQVPREPLWLLLGVEAQTSATIEGEEAPEGFLQVSCWQWVFGPKLGPSPSFLSQ